MEARIAPRCCNCRDCASLAYKHAYSRSSKEGMGTSGERIGPTILAPGHMTKRFKEEHQKSLKERQVGCQQGPSATHEAPPGQAPSHQSRPSSWSQKLVTQVRHAWLLSSPTSRLREVKPAMAANNAYVLDLTYKPASGQRLNPVGTQVRHAWLLCPSYKPTEGIEPVKAAEQRVCCRCSIGRSSAHLQAGGSSKSK